MKRAFLLLLSGMILLGVRAGAAEDETKNAASLESDAAKVSYVMGLNIGGGMRQQGLTEQEIDGQALIRGLNDALAGNPPALPQAEMQRVMTAFMQQVQQKFQAEAQENKAAAEAFLAENREEEGVQVTDSGLQYKIIRAGEGEQPTTDQIVTVHYKGMLPDGTVFDSSYERNEPVQLRLDSVIPAWKEALPMMKVGAKWKLWVPPALGYGMRGHPPKIKPNQLLIFEVELLNIAKAPTMGAGEK